MSVVVAVGEPLASQLADALADEGVAVVSTCEPGDVVQSLGDPSSPVWDGLRAADALLLPAVRGVLTPGVVAACDRHGVRIVPVGDRPAEARLARAFGLGEPLAPSAEGWRVAEALRRGPAAETTRADARPPGRVVVVWGPHGAPGRTTTAVELAVEAARRHGHVALVDADTHAPSVAVALGLADEGPGFAAACRQSELGALDGAELTRLSVPVGGADGLIEVLPGLNRVGRWPELSESRVAATLAACREWAEVTVVDVAASLEADEEIVSDLDASLHVGIDGEGVMAHTQRQISRKTPDDVQDWILRPPIVRP